MYQIGEICNIGGEERKVLGFDAQGFPITTTNLELQSEEVASELVTLEEYEAMVDGYEQKLKEVQPDFKGLLALFPLDRLTKEDLIEIAQFVSVPIDNDDATKAEIIALIEGA